MRRILLSAVAAAVLCAAASIANAQSFPNRPIRMIVSFPPGGATDVIARVVGALAHRLSGREQLVPRALGEPFGAHRIEQAVRGAQLLARVRATALAAQPFRVEQVRASELHALARAAEARDRLAVPALGGIPLAQERADTRLTLLTLGGQPKKMCSRWAWRQSDNCHEHE